MRVEVEVSFQFNQNSRIELTEATPLPEGTNVSNGLKVFDASNYSFKGFKGFHFGEVKDQWPATLDGTYNYYPEEGYKGFISKNITSAYGEAAQCIFQFFIKGEIPDSLFVSFDSVCNEYATELKITNSQNGNVIMSENHSWNAQIDLTSLALQQSDSLIISLHVLKWNRPFKGIKVTQISFTYVGVYTGSDLVSMDCSENLLDKQMNAKAGVCEQYADLEIYDRQEVLRTFAKREILGDEQRVSIRAFDNQNKEYLLGEYQVSSWNIDSNNSTVSITCKDSILAFDEVYIEAAEVASRTVDDMLRLVFSQLKNTTWKYLDSAVEMHCKGISTPNSWFYTDTLLKTLTKISLLGMLRIYWYVDSFVVARCY